MKLTENEKNKLGNLRIDLLAAAKYRNTNPSDFTHNIRYLRKLYEVDKSMMEMIKVHTLKMESLVNKKTSIFNKESVKKALKKELKIINHMKNFVMDSDVIAEIKSGMIAELRITSLEVSINQQRVKNRFFEFKETVEFKIEFNDGSSIKIATLDDEKKLAKFKKMFKHKMDELSDEKKLKALC